MKELQPVNQNVLLDLTEDRKEQKSAGGIIIPDTARERKNIAPIVGLSNISNAEIAIGDIVIYNPHSGNEIEFEGKKYLVIQYADIWAKVVETEEI
ncbi:MAG: co-chaperone GroES [Chitinophagaceae bacterium]|nr:co-chaperone GroES [Chitinophagaceae bacterium]